MNDKDRDELGKLGIRVGNLEKGQEDILKNHLPHISADAKSARFRSGVTMWVSGITIAFLTIGIAIIACLIALN